jgi:hypothetical protein
VCGARRGRGDVRAYPRYVIPKGVVSLLPPLLSSLPSLPSLPSKSAKRGKGALRVFAPFGENRSLRAGASLAPYWVEDGRTGGSRRPTAPCRVASEAGSLMASLLTCRSVTLSSLSDQPTGSLATPKSQSNQPIKVARALLLTPTPNPTPKSPNPQSRARGRRAVRGGRAPGGHGDSQGERGARGRGRQRAARPSRHDPRHDPGGRQRAQRRQAASGAWRVAQRRQAPGARHQGACVAGAAGSGRRRGKRAAASEARQRGCARRDACGGGQGRVTGAASRHSSAARGGRSGVRSGGATGARALPAQARQGPRVSRGAQGRVFCLPMHGFQVARGGGFTSFASSHT